LFDRVLPGHAGRIRYRIGFNHPVLTPGKHGKARIYQKPTVGFKVHFIVVSTLPIATATIREN